MSTTRPWFAIAGIAVIVGALSFAIGRRTAPARAIAPAAPQLESIDPVWLAPHATRLVFAADIARLRAAPSVAPFFAQWTSGGSCQARLGVRMRRVVGFARDATLDDMAFVFDGPVTRDELSQCIREGDRANTQVRTVQYRGFSLVQHAPSRESALLPPPETTELVQLGTLVAAGPSSAVRSMIDRALAGPSSASNALNPALKSLTERLYAGYAFALASLVTPRSRALESMMASVEGVAVGATANERLRVEAILACADFDSPRYVANALTAQQQALAQEPLLASVRPLIERATIERRAADVRATIELSGDDVSLTVLALRELARRIAAASAEIPDRPSQVEAQVDGGALRDR